MTDNRQLKKPVRYQPGNLGDLLKHGWLVEFGELNIVTARINALGANP